MRVICNVFAIFAFAVFVLLAPTAHADTLVYIFDGSASSFFGQQLSEEFQYTTAGFITTNTPLLAIQLDECTNCLVSTTLPAAEFLPGGAAGDTIGFVNYLGTENYFNFGAGVFTNPGFYFLSTPSISGSLLVTDFPDVSTPENSTITLVAIGLFGLFAVRRRKQVPGLHS
jgi:hypothetical protein